MKMQQKVSGGRQQGQFVIEEEGNYSQRSSEDESYSVGRSVGGISGAKQFGANAAKNFKISQQQNNNIHNNQMMMRNKANKSRTNNT
jgi:hypothetical protein